jgi:uncharacterized protein YsxB (DUF464 family)
LASAVLEVIVRRDGRQRLSSLFADGHSNLADEGSDVVCAAVSAILQAAWLGLEEVAKVSVKASKTKGRLSLRWPEPARDDAAVIAIVGTAERAVEAIAKQFPANVRLRRETEP